MPHNFFYCECRWLLKGTMAVLINIFSTFKTVFISKICLKARLGGHIMLIDTGICCNEALLSTNLINYNFAGEGCRLNPLNDIPNDWEFKARYRFDKLNIQRLVDLITPLLDITTTNRGLPCSAQQIVCSGLEILAGGHFFRVNGYCGGMATGTAWSNLYRLVAALINPTVRGQFLYMPTPQQQQDNMNSMTEKQIENVL